MTDGPLSEGQRIGRYVVLRDVDGRVHAIAAGSVAAACETDAGTLVLLPGARMVHVPHDLATVLGWLDAR